MLIALWTGSRLLYSMMAVGVLPLEFAWLADFVTGGKLTGLAAYMFDPREPAYVRALSGFHLFMPVIIIFMLIRQGYDRRAFKAQTALAWVVLAASY
ncbi:MAG: membrane-associated protein, partial [Mesorhizobium sp.]